jgi:hypothetical protein
MTARMQYEIYIIFLGSSPFVSFSIISDSSAGITNKGTIDDIEYKRIDCIFEQ